MIDATSPYENYCNGYQSEKNYFVGLTFGIGKTQMEFTHEGTSILDDINAFDRAEVEDITIGQINMIIVSSFCGPQGSVWGYHVARPKNLYKPHPYLPEGKVTRGKHTVAVYSAHALVNATKELFGTVKKKKFPLMPGSMVPCAGKHIQKRGPAHIYCGFGLGVVKDGEKNANLFMEDLGEIPLYIQGTNREKAYKHDLLENIAKSVLAIGENQKVEYKEIFVELKDLTVQSNEIGCALVAAPYFTIARNAVPKKGIEFLQKMSLDEWRASIRI
jgi:histidine decarboxylase